MERIEDSFFATDANGKAYRMIGVRKQRHDGQWKKLKLLFHEDENGRRWDASPSPTLGTGRFYIFFQPEIVVSSSDPVALAIPATG